MAGYIGSKSSVTLVDGITKNGGTLEGDLSFGDNDKAKFGAGDDLQIYHDGSNSYISDQGTNDLKVLATDFQLKNSADNEFMITAVTDGAVTAYHNGSAKLATTSTGVDVTGTVTADGLVVSAANANIDVSDTGTGVASQDFLTNSNAARTTIGVERSSGGGLFVGSSPYAAVFGSAGANPTQIASNNTIRMTVDSSGRVTKPNQPYFCIHSPGQSNITVGGYTLITLNQEEVDTGSNFSNNTFTAPVTGVYSLTLLIRLDDVMANSSYYNTSINTSNRSYPLLFSPNGFDSNVNYWQFTINVIADMDAGDTASCNVGQIGGSSGTDINNSTRFMGYLLG